MTNQELMCAQSDKFNSRQAVVDFLNKGKKDYQERIEKVKQARRQMEGI